MTGSLLVSVGFLGSHRGVGKQDRQDKTRVAHDFDSPFAPITHSMANEEMTVSLIIPLIVAHVP